MTCHKVLSIILKIKGITYRLALLRQKCGQVYQNNLLMKRGHFLFHFHIVIPETNFKF